MASIYFFGSHPFVNNMDSEPNVIDKIGTYLTVPTQYLHRTLHPIATDVQELIKSTEEGLKYHPKKKHPCIFGALYICSIVLPIFDAIGCFFRFVAMAGPSTRANYTFLKELEKAKQQLELAINHEAMATIGYTLPPAITVEPDLDSSYPLEAITKMYQIFQKRLAAQPNLHVSLEELESLYKEWNDPLLASQKAISWNQYLKTLTHELTNFYTSKAQEDPQKIRSITIEKIQQNNPQDYEELLHSFSLFSKEREETDEVYQRLKAKMEEISVGLIGIYQKEHQRAKADHEGLLKQIYKAE